MYMYVLGPLIGGCLAGMIHRVHILAFNRMQGRETTKPGTEQALLDDYKEAEPKPSKVIMS